MTTELYPRVYLYRRIVQAKLFIDSKYADKIDLDNISDEACFSKFHFIRLFNSIYGKTPHQYLTFVRIEKAQQLQRDMMQYW
jgi:AraC-like DNA-binding protein